MSMTAASRRELYKLRELVHFLLGGGGATPQPGYGPYCCFFCRKPLDEYAADFKTHGNSVGPKFLEKLSIHHINGNHDDNEDSNKALCHTKCHKGHHRKLANHARAAQQEKP